MTAIYPPFGTPAALGSNSCSPLASYHQRGYPRLSDSNREGRMSYLQQTIKAGIRPGEEFGYMAECLEIIVGTNC